MQSESDDEAAAVRNHLAAEISTKFLVYCIHSESERERDADGDVDSVSAVKRRRFNWSDFATKSSNDFKADLLSSVMKSNVFNINTILSNGK